MTTPDPTPPVRVGVLRQRARQRAAGLAVLPIRDRTGRPEPDRLSSAPEPAQPPGPIPASDRIRRPTSVPSLSPEQVAMLRAEHAAGVLHIGAIARRHGMSVALTMDAIYGRGAYRDVPRDESDGGA